MTPDFFIGGAQKSGTTSLHSMLQCHPEIFIPRRPQEIHYFDLDENYVRGPAWYESLFRDWRGQKRVGQTSPLYLYEPRAAKRIADQIPSARFIFILRHPLDRAYAHYWHEVKKGWEDLGFEEALAAETERIARGPAGRRHWSYLDRGRYATQLERFFRLFTREKVLVLLYEDLRSHPVELRRRCAMFLEIDPEAFPPDAGVSVQNPSRLPRWRLLQRITRDLRERHPRIVRLVDALNLQTSPYPPLAESLRRHWLERLEPEIRATEELLGRNLDAWRR